MKFIHSTDTVIQKIDDYIVRLNEETKNLEESEDFKNCHYLKLYNNVNYYKNLVKYYKDKVSERMKEVYNNYLYDLEQYNKLNPFVKFFTDVPKPDIRNYVCDVTDIADEAIHHDIIVAAHMCVDEALEEVFFRNRNIIVAHDFHFPPFGLGIGCEFYQKVSSHRETPVNNLCFKTYIDKIYDFEHLDTYYYRKMIDDSSNIQKRNTLHIYVNGCLDREYVKETQNLSEMMGIINTLENLKEKIKENNAEYVQYDNEDKLSHYFKRADEALNRKEE